MATNPDAPQVGHRRPNDITSHMAIIRPLDLILRSSDEDEKREDDNRILEDRKVEDPFMRPREERQSVSIMADHSATENIGLFNGLTENRPLKIDLR